MPLEGEAKKQYQRDYMRKRRAGLTGTNKGRVRPRKGSVAITTNREPDGFQEAFAYLTERQQVFLLLRFNGGYSTDASAIEELKLGENFSAQAQKSNSFAYCYEVLKQDLLERRARHREEALAIIDSTLPEAALELRKLVNKPWDGISDRLASTKKGAIDSVLKAGQMFEEGAKETTPIAIKIRNMLIALTGSDPVALKGEVIDAEVQEITKPEEGRCDG